MYMKENTIIYAQQAQRIGQSSPLSIILTLCHHDGTLFYPAIGFDGDPTIFSLQVTKKNNIKLQIEELISPSLYNKVQNILI